MDASTQTDIDMSDAAEKFYDRHIAHLHQRVADLQRLLDRAAMALDQTNTIVNSNTQFFEHRINLLTEHLACLQSQLQQPLTLTPPESGSLLTPTSDANEWFEFGGWQAPEVAKNVHEWPLMNCIHETNKTHCSTL